MQVRTKAVSGRLAQGIVQANCFFIIILNLSLYHIVPHLRRILKISIQTLNCGTVAESAAPFCAHT